MSDESIEQRIDMKVALAENGFYVTWSEPVPVKPEDDAFRRTVKAVAGGVGDVMAAQQGRGHVVRGPDGVGEAVEGVDGAEEHHDDPEAWRGTQHLPTGGRPDQFTGAIGTVLAAINEIEDKQSYRLVRRSIVCSKPEDVLPAIARAEAAFKDLMKLRLEGALLEAD